MAMPLCYKSDINPPLVENGIGAAGRTELLRWGFMVGSCCILPRAMGLGLNELRYAWGILRRSSECEL